MSNPDTLPPVVYRDAEIVYMPHWVDTSLAVIKNTDNKVFPKPHVEPISIGIIHGIRWSTTYSNANYQNELNAINTDTWRSWAPGHAWVSRILTEDEEINGVECTKIHYIVRCNRYGWNITMPQMGFVEGTPEFLDGMGDVTTSPISSGIAIKHGINFTTTLKF
jgi:hypothetical protein